MFDLSVADADLTKIESGMYEWILVNYRWLRYSSGKYVRILYCRFTIRWAKDTNRTKTFQMIATQAGCLHTPHSESCTTYYLCHLILSNPSTNGIFNTYISHPLPLHTHFTPFVSDTTIPFLARNSTPTPISLSNTQNPDFQTILIHSLKSLRFLPLHSFPPIFLSHLSLPICHFPFSPLCPIPPSSSSHPSHLRTPPSVSLAHLSCPSTPSITITASTFLPFPTSIAHRTKNLPSTTV